MRDGKIPNAQHEEDGERSYTPRVTLFGGGDMMYVSHVLGLHGKFSTKTGESCCWCEAPRKQLGKPQPSQKRTLERIYNLAHLPFPDPSANYAAKFPFECPGCHAVFQNYQVHDGIHCAHAENEFRASTHYGHNRMHLM